MTVPLGGTPPAEGSTLVEPPQQESHHGSESRLGPSRPRGTRSCRIRSARVGGGQERADADGRPVPRPPGGRQVPLPGQARDGGGGGADGGRAAGRAGGAQP